MPSVGVVHHVVQSVGGSARLVHYTSLTQERGASALGLTIAAIAVGATCLPACLPALLAGWQRLLPPSPRAAAAAALLALMLAVGWCSVSLPLSLGLLFLPLAHSDNRSIGGPSASAISSCIV